MPANVGLKEKDAAVNFAAVGTTPVSQKKQARMDLCSRAWNCLNVMTVMCENYASRFLRLSFFTLNIVMF